MNKLSFSYCVVGLLLIAPQVGIAHSLLCNVQDGTTSEGEPIRYDTDVFAPIDESLPRSNVQLQSIVRDDLSGTDQSDPNAMWSPLKGAVADGEKSCLYIVDQKGYLWAVDLNAELPGNKRKFLDVSDMITPFGPRAYSERGLLGATFHPDYRKNGLLYTYTSEPLDGEADFSTVAFGTADHQSVIREWKVTNDKRNHGQRKNIKGCSEGEPVFQRKILVADQPQSNHNGGDVVFGPDNNLYISLGDGGAANDGANQPTRWVGHSNLTGGGVINSADGVWGNGQDITNVLGTILRINPTARLANSANGQYGIPASNPFVGLDDPVVKEIYAYGFRNPFRISFDRKTGQLYVADVGQNDLEELNLVVSGGNYGWPLKEGTAYFRPDLESADLTESSRLGSASREKWDNVTYPDNLVDPIAEYDTHHEGHSIVGGFVYRGNKIKSLKNRYIFGDWTIDTDFSGGHNNFGRLFYVDVDKKKPGRNGRGDADLLSIREFNIPAEFQLGGDPAAAAPDNNFAATCPKFVSILGFAEDANGELYVLGNLTGTPLPIPPENTVGVHAGIVLKITGG